MPTVLRATMDDLIALVRLKIGDAPGASEQFADTDIQNALDEGGRREYVRYEVLYPQVKYTTGTFQYLDYCSRRRFWEKGEEVIGPRYQPLTPSSVDYLGGHWIFPAGSGIGQYPPVFVAGNSYDLYGACADLCDAWAAALARKYDFSTGGASFHRSQMAQALLKQAEVFRRKARVKQVRMVRSDVDPTSATTANDRVSRLGPVSAGVPFVTGD